MRDFVAFLPHGRPSRTTCSRPEAPDAALANAPEPPRETAYADVRAAVAAGAGDAAADALLGGNALAFLRRALPEPSGQAMPAAGAGAGSGLCGRPGRASPVLYSRGATSLRRGRVEQARQRLDVVAADPSSVWPPP